MKKSILFIVSIWLLLLTLMFVDKYNSTSICMAAKNESAENFTENTTGDPLYIIKCDPITGEPIPPVTFIDLSGNQSEFIYEFKYLMSHIFSYTTLATLFFIFVLLIFVPLIIVIFYILFSKKRLDE